MKKTHWTIAAWLCLVACSTSACSSGTSDERRSDERESRQSKKKKKKKKRKKGSEAKAATSEQASDKPAKDVPAPPFPKPIIMGAAGEHDNLIVTVRSAKDVAPTPQSEKPGAGQKLMAVSILVAAKEGSAMVAGAMFDLVGDGGQRFRSSMLPCTDTPLKAGSATMEAPVAGDLCFVVPSDGVKLQLMLKSGGKDALPFKLGF